MNAPADLTSFEGCLERITFHNPENHYTIARFRPSGARNPITVVGFMPAPSPGESLRLDGVWETHSRYGQQLKIERFEVLLPATVDGIRNYLKSGVIKGLSAKIISRLIRRFGDQTLEVIESTPEKLQSVKGIGKAIAQQIADSWKSHHAVRNLMIFLQDHTISLSYSGRIFRQYGGDAVDILTHRPYQIAVDMPGIGFYIADRIAQHQGAAPDDPQRIRACILYLLEQTAADGNMFMTDTELLRHCAATFAVTVDLTSKAISELTAEGALIQEPLSKAATPETASNETAIYLPELHEAEAGISRRLRASLSIPVMSPDLDQEQMTHEILNRLAIQLSAGQQAVLETVLRHRAAIITGGPGTGKTTLIRSISAICDRMRRKTILSAPTGRAARRLSEVARKKALTLHKLLGYNPDEGGFQKNEDDPLDADVMIVDEASMVDARLMYRLLKALPVTATLILVGDVFQLPSVGPGNVLSDMIRSGVIETFELSEIFRQAKESPIVMNAHRIRHGQLPDLCAPDGESGLSEFYFIEQSLPESVVNIVVELCSRKIPEKFGYDAVQDIQVMAPMHKGTVGVIQLNQALQQALNPQGQSPKGFSFKTGDKVMHLKNNYAKEVFNGDIGVVTDINALSRQLTVTYDDRQVAYENEEFEDLTLAYAISVHKSQGSEYPAVVIPLMPQHYPLLQRNLLYTAITRGKKLVIIVGSRQALNRAVLNDRQRNRLSRLDKRLAGLI